ncbi:hypothetical protein Gotri_024375 [Gossypium trilobum]|uniref:Cytochrome b5 heme-binding domain-containing protein n=1 Tax=Gossypium trilobum TaxID=34281 RepID=A0A7J9DM75_9ROSI|nr:hypothetical protein [Gossypium trilobum]
MGSDSKIHSFEEVAKHNKNEDCWLIISGKVRDLGLFLFDYGVVKLMKGVLAGKDGTNDFEDIGHSEDAREMMEKYYIGEIDEETVPQKRTYIPPHQMSNDTASEFFIKLLQFLVPLLLLGLAISLRNYTKKE